MPVAKIDPALEERAGRARPGACARGATPPSTRARSRRSTTRPPAAATSCAPIVGAVKAMATVGEIADVLRKRFGEYHPST